MRYLITLLLIAAFSMPVYGNTFKVSDDLLNKNSFTGQTDAGGFITQAMKEITGADAAFFTSCGIKKGLSRGTFDISVISELLYYPDDKVVIMELTGTQLKAVLEKSIGDYPVENSNFLQTSGITGVFNPSSNEGKKIISIYVNGSEVSDNSTYRIAMDETLAGGFFGYTTFTKAKLIKNTSLSLTEVLQKYIEAHPVVGKPQDWGLKAK